MLNGGAIEGLTVDPAAEPHPETTGKASGQQEQKFFDDAKQRYALQANSQNMGWLGKFFGRGPAAATNIAGVVCLLSVLLLAATFIADKPNVEAIRWSLTGLASSSLGYIFGASKSGEK